MPYIGIEPLPTVSERTHYGVIDTPSNVITLPETYVPNNIEVFINGSRIPPSDYVALDGNTVHFLTTYPAGTEWLVQDMVAAILSVHNVVQSTGSSTADVMSQKAVTDELNTKLGSDKVAQSTGDSTTGIMSQKAVTDIVKPTLVVKTITSGAVAINANSEYLVKVILNADVTNFSITGGAAGSKVTLILEQDLVGFRQFNLPSNVQPGVGDTQVVGVVPRDVTMVELTHNGAHWLWTVLSVSPPTGGVYASTPRASGWVPPSFNENTLVNDEGTSTNVWTATNLTTSLQGSSAVRFTFPTTDWANATRTITTVPANRDFISYFKVKGSYTGFHSLILVNGTDQLSVRFNLNTANVAAPGMVSLASAGSVEASYDCGTFLPTNDYAEFALWRDSTYGVAYLFLRLTEGGYRLLGRIRCANVAFTTLTVFGAASTAGYWFEYDYISVCKPNIMSIGDSICEGIPHFNRNITEEPDAWDYFNTWQCYTHLYKNMRNNLIVNKGVSGNSSTMIQARFTADIVNHGPRLVIIGTSSNDGYWGIVTPAARNSALQSCINAANGIGAKTLLLAPMVAHLASTVNPGAQRYKRQWEAENLDALTGLAGYLGYIDIGKAVRSKFTDSMRFDLANDPGHPNQAGHAEIGKMIERTQRVS